MFKRREVTGQSLNSILTNLKDQHVMYMYNMGREELKTISYLLWNVKETDSCLVGHIKRVCIITLKFICKYNK